MCNRRFSKDSKDREGEDESDDTRRALNIDRESRMGLDSGVNLGGRESRWLWRAVLYEGICSTVEVVDESGWMGLSESHRCGGQPEIVGLHAQNPLLLELNLCFNLVVCEDLATTVQYCSS